VTSILYIFLPCKQIYPVGCTYLADYIHKRHPEVRQRILDLSQIPHGERAQAVRETAENVRPDLVCFSWRDIQIFRMKGTPRWSKRSPSITRTIRSRRSPRLSQA